MTALAVSKQSVLKKPTVDALCWAETRLDILLDIGSAQGHYVGWRRTPNTPSSYSSNRGGIMEWYNVLLVMADEGNGGGNDPPPPPPPPPNGD